MKKQSKNEVALSTANVSNNINLNLNQNDLIEMAIQEKLSLLEDHIATLETKIKEEWVLQDLIRKNLLHTIKTTILKKDKKYQSFLSKVKLLKMDIKESDLYVQSGNKYECTYEYKTFESGRAEQYKNPFSYIDYARRTNTGYYDSISSIKISCMAVDEKSNLKLDYQVPTITLSKAVCDNYFTKLKSNTDIIVKLQNELANLKEEHFSYLYSEKKIKSQIIKKSLSKSPEGKAILQMLAEASNIKFLK
jgi:hypothetical protein